jgi:Transposase DDE domain group 1
MTECSQSSLGFEGCGRREVVASFDGGTISSDGGSLLLRQTDQRLNLLPRLAACFVDRRDPERIEHSVQEMLSQRIYGLALGYEDLNDHEDLRMDPLFGLLAGRIDLERPLAGKSTLNRMELGNGLPDRYKKITFWRDSIDELMVAVFLESQKAPEQIILDIDTTDLPLHGKQEGRFFHGYYDCYCYLPLFVFCGEHVLCARLRESNRDASAGSLTEIQRIVGQLRAAWPETRIILRGDSGFCRNQLMSWCEANQVDYVFGLARNQRLRRIIGREMWQAGEEWNRTGKPARIFAEFSYTTKSTKKRPGWDRPRRVVAKAEHIDGKENPRFVVTSLSAEQWPAQSLYEELYCGRGDIENRIKEQFTLFADRVSAETMRANQLRLYLSVMTYMLVSGLRRLGLKATEMAEAQVATIRTKLLKIGAQIRVTVRRIYISLSSSSPSQQLFRQVWANLRC